MTQETLPVVQYENYSVYSPLAFVNITHKVHVSPEEKNQSPSSEYNG
jgi:hypothetical protein